MNAVATLPGGTRTGRCAIVSLPGTCGEWVQGTLDGVPCLVSCPIDWYGTVTVEIGDTSGPRILPPAGAKTAVAVARALAATGEDGIGVTVRSRNPLPRSRGYASSTVDVAGAILATGRVFGRPFEAAEAARLAVSVEPSDGIMFPGLTLLAHRDASFHRELGPVPELAVVVIDPGGSVDTVAFNQTDHRAALAGLAPRHRDAFEQLAAGLARGDRQAVAEAATQSALAHQALLPNPLLEPALALARRAGGLGILRAHSGTLAGIICEPDVLPALADRAQTQFPDCTIRRHRCL